MQLLSTRADIERVDPVATTSLAGPGGKRGWFSKRGEGEERGDPTRSTKTTRNVRRHTHRRHPRPTTGRQEQRGEADAGFLFVAEEVVVVPQGVVPQGVVVVAQSMDRGCVDSRATLYRLPISLVLSATTAVYLRGPLLQPSW